VDVDGPGGAHRLRARRSITRLRDDLDGDAAGLIPIRVCRGRRPAGERDRGRRHVSITRAARAAECQFGVPRRGSARRLSIDGGMVTIA